jgi:hypothetical protein
VVLREDRAAGVDHQIVTDVERHGAGALPPAVVIAVDGAVDGEVTGDGEDTVDDMIVVIGRAVERCETDGAADNDIVRIRGERRHEKETDRREDPERDRSHGNSLRKMWGLGRLTCRVDFAYLAWLQPTADRTEMQC